MKKTAVFLAILLVSLMSFTPVSAAPAPVVVGDYITAESLESVLRWTEVSSVAHGVTINSSGRATVSSTVNTYSSTSRIELTAYLQKQSGSSFYDYDYFTASGTGRAAVSEGLYVERGTYRVHTVATIYSASGAYIETVDTYSTASTY